MDVTVSPGRIDGRVLIPSSKSHTIRALVVASLADGESRIETPLDSADTRSCMAVLRGLGVPVEEIHDEGQLTGLVVDGQGGTFSPPGGDLDCGNSGTTFYLMLSVASLAGFPVTLTGDHQLQRRSAGPLLHALESLGVVVDRHGAGDCAPITVTGPLRGGLCSVSCPTSQYLTSLLLSTPLAPVDSDISVPLLNERPYVEMTLSWLESQGIRYERTEWSAFSVEGRQHYKAFTRRMPGDFSAATFFLAAAAVTGSVLELDGLDMADSQGDREVVPILERLGCSVTAGGHGLRIAGPKDGTLAGGTLDLNGIPDALPALAVVGTACREPLRLENVPQAREKETDRIATMAKELSALGAQVEELDDGLVIHPSVLRGGRVSSHGDHRIAMALAVAGLRSTAPVSIEGAEAAGITYPGFYDALRLCGAKVSVSPR